MVLYGVASKMTEFLVTYWISASATRGNEVNGFYIGLYAMLALIGLLGLVMAVVLLALVVVPRSAEVLHERLLNTVMNAPLSFFT